MNRPHHYSLNAHLNNVVGNVPQKNSSDVLAAVNHQRKIILSELEELIQGLMTNNRSVTRDGLGDVIVTTDGMFHRADIAHLYPDKDSLVKSGTGLAEVFRKDVEVKPTHALAHYLHTVATSFFQADFSEMNAETINYILVPHLLNLLVYAYVAADLVNADVDEDQILIYNSNMSKFDTSPEDAEIGAQAYRRKNIEVFVEPVIEGGTTYFIIKSAKEQLDGSVRPMPAGKFLKSSGFKEPDFSEPNPASV